MTEAELKNTLVKLLHAFYAGRLETLRSTTLANLLANSQLMLCAIDEYDASSVIELSLQVFLTAADKSIFENLFFEPLITAVQTYEKAIAPPHPGTTGGPEDQQMRAQAKTPVVTCAAAYWYRISAGKLTDSPTDRYGREKSWQFTNDINPHIKMVELVKAEARLHARQYKEARTMLANRLNSIFLLNFVTPKGYINWGKLIEYSSDRNARIQLWQAVKEPGTDSIVLVEIIDAETDANSAEKISKTPEL